jgi:hypothetical protein
MGYFGWRKRKNGWGLPVRDWPMILMPEKKVT